MEGDGTLLCSYHGWRFDSEGKCTAIPQVSSPAAACFGRSLVGASASEPTFSHAGRRQGSIMHLRSLGALLQANEEKVESTACASSRSCVKSYPVQVQPSIVHMQARISLAVMHLERSCNLSDGPFSIGTMVSAGC